MTIDFPSRPPDNKKQLFERLREILQHGPYDMPCSTRYGGHGGPGCLLEDLIGLKVGSQSIPDSVGWELKYYTDKTALITLFHREAQPRGVMRLIVRNWGWRDEKGRMSFRHTIAGKSDRYKWEPLFRLPQTPPKAPGSLSAARGRPSQAPQPHPNHKSRLFSARKSQIRP